jgi:opacity protein-like surface antigen
MKRTSVIYRTAGVIALSAFFMLPALADDPHFYLGVNVGQSTYDVKVEESELFNLPYFTTQTGTQINDKDIAASLAFGYSFMKYLSAEVAVSNFGEYEYNEQGFLSPTVGGKIQSTVKSHGLSLAAVGTLPFGSFELYGKLGAMYAKAEIDLLTTSMFGSIPDGNRIYYPESESTEVLYAIGAGYNTSDHVFVGIEWMRVPNLGDKDEIGFEFDVDVVSLKLQFNF